MSGFTLSDIRAALKAQLAEKLDAETNVYAYDEGTATPSVSLILDSPPEYFLTFNRNGIAAARFRVRIDPGNTDESAVMRLDDYLSCGQGNGSSVVDALVGDGELEALGLSLDIEPGLYDQVGIVADLVVTVNVQKI